MQNVNTNPAARHKPGPSQTPWFGISCYPAPHFFCGDATTPSFLRLSTSQRSLDLLQVRQPGGFKRAARGGRGVGLSDSRGAFFGAAFVRRVDGQFIWVHCSASSASRIHVRAMSIRISRTRAFGACAAIRWHSAARTLHLSAVSMAVPRKDPSHLFPNKTPPRPGRNQRGFRCAWHGMDLPS